MLQHGDPDGPVWRNSEADVSIRPGWFRYRPGRVGYMMWDVHVLEESGAGRARLFVRDLTIGAERLISGDG
jgi:hypothetical protein